MVAMFVGLVLVALALAVVGGGALLVTTSAERRARRRRGPSGSHPAGRGGAGVGSVKQPERPRRGVSPRGPDDDPEFLRSLQDRLRREDGPDGRDGDA